MSRSEAEECVVFIKNKVSDSNEYSELYGRLTWVQNETPALKTATAISAISAIQIALFSGGLLVKAAVAAYAGGYWSFSPEWTKNDLDLIFEERMVGSTKIFDVKFNNQKPKGTIHGLENVKFIRRR